MEKRAAVTISASSGAAKKCAGHLAPLLCRRRGKLVFLVFGSHGAIEELRYYSFGVI
jgi:hypothetical protein